MKSSLGLVVAVVVMLCVAAGCGKRDTSPVIACELNGKIVSADFTYESFKAALAAEHGHVEAVPGVSLKSDALQVYFKKLDDGRLLAERVVLVGGVMSEMPAAVLFGLTNKIERVDGKTLVPPVSTGAQTEVPIPSMPAGK